MWSGLGRRTSKEAIAGAFWVLRATQTVRFEGCVAEPLLTIPAILPGSNIYVLCCRMHHVRLQILYLPLKLRVLCGRHHCALERKEEGIGGDGGESFKKVKEDVEEKGVKLSITENGKEEQNGYVVQISGSGSAVKKKQWEWQMVSKRWELTQEHKLSGWE